RSTLFPYTTLFRSAAARARSSAAVARARSQRLGLDRRLSRSGGREIRGALAGRDRTGRGLVAPAPQPRYGLGDHRPRELPRRRRAGPATPRSPAVAEQIGPGR